MVSTPHPEYTLDRAHHQQRGPIKNPTTITVWCSQLQTPSLLWSHLQSWPQSGSFSGTVRQYYWSAQAMGDRERERILFYLLGEKTRPAETVENDLRPLNMGLATAQRRAQNRTAWQTLVETAIRRWQAPNSTGWRYRLWHCKATGMLYLNIRRTQNARIAT